MTINLNTGSVQVPRSPSRPHGLGNLVVGTLTEFNDTTPAEAVVFPSTDRRLLLVEPNTMLVVTGYNLNSNTKIVFRKVLRSNGIPAQGTADCCPSITIANSIRLHSVELPCWRLDRCNPVFIIKTPGSYEIDVIGDYADVVVTAMMFAMQEVNEFNNCECPSIEQPIIEPELPPTDEIREPIDIIIGVPTEEPVVREPIQPELWDE